MSFNPEELEEFARHYGFHHALYDVRAVKEDFKLHMKRGLAGEESSLAMLPSYIKAVPQKWKNRTVIALDAGGTNLRAALVRFDEAGKREALETKVVPMPGTRGRIGAAAFFDGIAGLVIPLLAHNPEGIGFCFSYPMRMTRDNDGILLALSKEVDAPGLVGMAIGASLKDAVGRMGAAAPGRVVLLNDTAAALLAGMAEKPGADGPVIGFILGTGTNIAYPEKNIPKIAYSGTSPELVVMESGNFAYREQGELDRSYDETTKNPGKYALEKAAAGAYLGPLSFHIFKRAIQDGILDFRRREDFLNTPVLETKDLNAFLHNPLDGEGALGSFFDNDEIDAKKTVCCLASLVTERAARLSAATLAATVEWLTEDSASPPPLRIAVEGTTYLRYKGMRPALESCLESLVADTGRFAIEPVEQASLFGAAAAALLE